jgi:primosomal protein N' (replication factor Y)
LQTGDPGHTVIKHFKYNDYKGFFKEQLAERKTFLYPPYVRLIKLTLRHKKLPVVNRAAEKLAFELKHSLGNRVIGPEFPLINRIYSFHQKCIMVKLDRDKHFSDRKRMMQEAIVRISTSNDFKGIRIIADVDPYN